MLLPPGPIGVIRRHHLGDRAADTCAFGVRHADAHLENAATQDARDFQSHLELVIGADGAPEAVRAKGEAKRSVAGKDGAEQAGDGGLDQAAGNDDVADTGETDTGGVEIAMDGVAVAGEDAILVDLLAGEADPGLVW